jgi:ATP-binding cassette subfamily B protein
MFRPMRELADKFNTLQMGMVSSERIFKMLDMPSGIRQNGNINEGHLTGEIEFKDVWFAYNEEDWVLKGINLRIRPGETVAFVGATGAGKSTIINLITRLYDIQKGSITIDGNDIKEYDINYLRGNVAIVLQDVFLFSDSIYQNITLGDDSIDPRKVREAASTVGASGFIERLPEGFDYNVNERGVMLSMGQRQLISFIRAYVRDPSILVLDEATSSIDPESELLISEATKKITANRTSLVIAHRLSTIKTADRIVVMDHGRVVEEGSHTELLQQNGTYRKLYDIQFRHFEKKAG